jgi:hypothetical protein
VDAAIGRFEDSSRRRAHVVEVRVPGHAGHRSRAIPYRADVPKLELVVNVWIYLRLLCSRRAKKNNGCENPYKENNPHSLFHREPHTLSFCLELRG